MIALEDSTLLARRSGRDDEATGLIRPSETCVDVVEVVVK
jgi:hypothetical protein